MSNENLTTNEITIQVGCNNSATIVQYSSNEQLSQDLGWPKWVRMDKVRRIANLPIQPFVLDKICSGESNSDVARYIQSSGYLTSNALSTVIILVDHYRATIPKTIMYKRLLPPAVTKAVNEARKRINVTDMMAWAVETQKKRIEKYLEIENTSPIPIPETRKEIETFVKMNQAYVEIEEKAFGDKHLYPENQPQGQVIDMSKVYSRESVNKVLGDPRSRFKVVQAVERIVDLIESKKNKETEVKEISVESSQVLEDVEEVVSLDGVVTHVDAEVVDGAEERSATK